MSKYHKISQNKIFLSLLSRIPGAVADSLIDADGGKLAALNEKVSSFNERYKVVAAPALAPATAPQSVPRLPQTPQPEARTLSQPQFSDGDKPLDVTQTLEPAATLELAEFQATKELLEITQISTWSIMLHHTWNHQFSNMAVL